MARRVETNMLRRLRPRTRQPLPESSTTIERNHMLKNTFEEDLATAVAWHGHLCAGQVLGTKIARLGLEHMGIDDPASYRDLIAFVEADRCVADAVCSVACCKLGRRRLKWFDYGKMAATFYDIPSKRAVRIAIVSDKKAPEGADIAAFFNSIPDEELFRIQEVQVDLTEDDLPGKPRHKAVCEHCGERVTDGRERIVGGRVLCAACAGEKVYYQVAHTVNDPKPTEDGALEPPLHLLRRDPWSIYDMLIDGVPDDIAVLDFALGTSWSYVTAECGCGVAMTMRGGGASVRKGMWRPASLKDMARLSKSWNLQDATLGIAALNAWYSRRELIDPWGAVYEEARQLAPAERKREALHEFRPAMKDKKVTVIGHFPHVLDLADHCAELTVLERNCREGDTPDSACEFILPSQDLVFITGTTFTNKTLPRLLQLTRDATCVMTGPSVVADPRLFDFGVDVLAGSVVGDPEKTAYCVKNGNGRLFGEAIQMMRVCRPGLDIEIAD